MHTQRPIPPSRKSTESKSVDPRRPCCNLPAQIQDTTVVEPCPELFPAALRVPRDAQAIHGANLTQRRRLPLGTSAVARKR